MINFEIAILLFCGLLISWIVYFMIDHVTMHGYSKYHKIETLYSLKYHHQELTNSWTKQLKKSIAYI